MGNQVDVAAEKLCALFEGSGHQVSAEAAKDFLRSLLPALVQVEHDAHEEIEMFAESAHEEIHDEPPAAPEKVDEPPVIEEKVAPGSDDDSLVIADDAKASDAQE